MADTCIAFLWHLHQPLYLEPGNGRVAMPWVRLHATKGYTDLVAMLDDYPHVHCTINVVPSLLMQLDRYAANTVEDPALELLRAPADALTGDQVRQLLRIAFQVNWTTQVHPNRRYRELLEKRGTVIPKGGPGDEVIAKFSAQDLRDLQVWNTLAWMGFTLRQREPAIAAALAKGRDFTEHEKRLVLDAQRRAVAEVIPRLKRVQDRGQLEVTTSPFYHPILPLLINTDITKRAIPDATVPAVPFSAPEDAATQLRLAVGAHRKWFDRAPRGCWPSEGSVCPEVIPLLAAAGFEWCASDEGILANSHDVSDARPGVTQPYTALWEDARITIVFRDRDLSDRIGFTYSSNTGADAAQDFLRRAEVTAARATRRERMVPVILDGENPWEYYPDGGEGFLRRLYAEVEASRQFRLTTISEAIAHVGAGPTIGRLHSGSWIHANFTIWGNGREESAAWDALRRTRDFLVRHERTHSHLTEEQRALAWDNLYAAEGSDWFWWYGDDFHSENDVEFDRLFRLHLEGVYTALGVEPPFDLLAPRAAAETLPEFRPAREFIRPTIDGKVTDYYEWEGAARHVVTAGQAIHIAGGAVTTVYCGFDRETLYLRADLEMPLYNSDGTPGELRWLLHGAHPWRLRCAAAPQPRAQITVERVLDDGTTSVEATLDSVAVQDIAELAVPWGRLDAGPGQHFTLALHVFVNGLVTERIPRDGGIPLVVPSPAFEADTWIV